MKKIFVTMLVAVAVLLFANNAMAQYGRDVYRNNDRYENRGYDKNYHRDRGPYYDRDEEYGRNYNNRYYYRGYDNRRMPVVPWGRYHNYNYRHHVYFPDYNLFYDPYRGGYEYMYGNRWIFSETLPRFLANINLGMARITIMGNAPLMRAPHYYYNDYARRYPARRTRDYGRYGY